MSRPGVCRPALAALAIAWLALPGCAGRAGRTAAAPPLPATPGERLAAAFAAAPDDFAIWSLQFVWADTGEVLYERQPDTRLLPASNMKLVTLAAAAQRLGWDYRFRTTVTASVAPQDGVLAGPLEVRGGGDPTFGWPTDEAMAQMRALAAQVRAQGIVRVEGPLVGDPDRFGTDRFGDAWSWDDLSFGYAAPYAGLTFHENTVRLRVTGSAAADQPATVTVEPPGSGLRVDADVTTVDADAPRRLSVERALGGDTLVVRGEVLPGQSTTRYLAVPDAPRFFLEALRVALALEGVDVRGETRVAPLPPLAMALPAPVHLIHESAPLSEVAVRFMKVSQNLYGEALQHALAQDPDADLATRRTAVSEALAGLGVATDDLQVADGSGLSRRNFVSARIIVALLQALAQPPHREHVRRTLPVAGVDGTLERRLAGTACEGRILAKTGTLSHARALSGYLTTAGGREVIFSVLANNYLQPTADVDAVVDGALLTLCGPMAATSTPVPTPTTH